MVGLSSFQSPEGVFTGLSKFAESSTAAMVIGSVTNALTMFMLLFKVNQDKQSEINNIDSKAR